MVLYTTFFFLPIALSFMYSLTDWDGLQKTFTFIRVRELRRSPEV